MKRRREGERGRGGRDAEGEERDRADVREGLDTKKRHRRDGERGENRQRGRVFKQNVKGMHMRQQQS